MKLNETDKTYLKSLGYEDRDFSQIERAIEVATYEERGKRMPRKTAIERMGRTVWLNGIARSAFHWSAVRLDKEGFGIYIDSSKLWERK